MNLIVAVDKHWAIGKKGQLLVSFDMEKVKAAGYDVTTPLIVTNSDDYKDMKILSEDSVTPSDKVLEIVK